MRKVFETEDFAANDPTGKFRGAEGHLRARVEDKEYLRTETRRRRSMRFLAIYRTRETGSPPSPENMAAMGKFIEEMAVAGVLLATEGCQPSEKGARVRISDGKFTVTDGPFTETKEV